jgi:hypothetical protein
MLLNQLLGKMHTERWVVRIIVRVWRRLMVIFFTLLAMHRRLVLAGMTTVLSIPFSGCTSGEVAGQCDSDTSLGLVVYGVEIQQDEVELFREQLEG